MFAQPASSPAPARTAIAAIPVQTFFLVMVVPLVSQSVTGRTVPPVL